VVHDGVPLRCATCGRELQGDRDDDPNGPNGPICGECGREDEFVQIDLLDGELDGHLG
jgi:DNA-directed RNA polymerase subunit RPC12/RpoP